MANVTRNIGLSLGADICWPGCFEEIVKRLNLSLPIGGDSIDFHIERVTIDPYYLRQPVRYDVVLDRLTHWFHTSREWIKKAVIMDGLYVLNNPWSLQSMEKHSTYCAMMKLGMPIPETWMIPPKERLTENPDVHPTMERYGRKWELEEIGERLGYPFFMKPYDGGAWVGVSRIDNPQQLRRAYEESGKRVMHLQKAVDPFDLFVRAIGIGPQVHIVKYDPAAPLHDRYKVDFFFVNGEEWSVLTDTCLTINAFFGWEFNSCESLRKDGVFHPIDFANACPDFQVTSLHYHFPDLVKNMVRWAIFCAATKREKSPNLSWDPFFAIAKQDLPYRERLKGYAKIANERMETERFNEFCAKHLSHLDEVALEFFGTDVAKGYVRQKVAALFPQHEVHRFTEHFWGLVQFWRKTETDRLNSLKPAEPEPTPIDVGDVGAVAAAPLADSLDATMPEAVFTAPPVAAAPVAAAPAVAAPAVAAPIRPITGTASKPTNKKSGKAKN
ncbi:hypothetical protein [Nannocystis sp.]|uniref:ATP-grasp domain-containing protein n=1 Tax=Nannocystis sp. TaxID=1962667 RepID=UPI0024253B99|nr:hypothetical protein [Nannocystis sp.]MBK7824582.1 hypothetical protein [Nannocystis sp.]MBK9753166.1 hypothetical protein [Nannocystis sp.]